MAETNHNRTSSSMDRRASRRESMRLSLGEEEIYDLAAMGISDGFRPTTNAPAGHYRVSSHSSGRETRSTPPPRPSSTTKPKYLDSFALGHDGAAGVSNRPTTRASSSGTGTITRSSSVSTDMPVMRAESPYQGPVGPSHPYHMYPQNTRLARTASTATTSTNSGQPERLYPGQRGPAHPYEMYPQNTVPETESIHDSIAVSSIPVGFPGRGGNYQRRGGPDGEEAADLIGPLGHTEQLPPYTKYPDEAFARRAVPTLPDLSGAGGIGLATRNPEFASREDLGSPLSRQSNRSITSDSDHQINTAALTSSEKPPDKKWKIVARRKVWGIVPIWVFVLVALIFLVFILILAIVLKIFMHHMPSSSKSSPVASLDAYPSATLYTTITTIEAQSLSTVPTGIPPLPTGTYLLPITTPESSQTSCLDTYSLSSTWSCALPPNSINITVVAIPGNPNKTSNYKIKLCPNSVPMVYFYGTQPPIMYTEQILNLVNDTQQLQRGPAWYFKVPYNKLVVVPENTLSSPSNRKRDIIEFQDYSRSFSQKEFAQIGDRLWFCHWNSTILEAFIYVNQSSSSGAQEASMLPPIIDNSATTSLASPSTITTTAPSAATSTLGEIDLNPDILSSYPKIIKVDERRLASSPPPFCAKMMIKSDGAAAPVLDEIGEMIIVYLNETETSIQSTPAKRNLPDDCAAGGAELVQRQTVRSCQCEWLSS